MQIAFIVHGWEPVKGSPHRNFGVIMANDYEHAKALLPKWKQWYMAAQENPKVNRHRVTERTELRIMQLDTFYDGGGVERKI